MPDCTAEFKLRTFELSVAINVPPRVGVSAVRLLTNAAEPINTPENSKPRVFSYYLSYFRGELQRVEIISKQYIRYLTNFYCDAKQI